MRRTEAGCCLEINLATGNIERVATDPEVMAHNLGIRPDSINEPCGGFCRHSLEKCIRIQD